MTLKETNTDVLTEFKEILCKAIKAHEVMSESDYDDGFHNGLLHSLTLLNDYERKKQEQAKDYPKLRPLFVDYAPAEGCKNDESYWAVCVKCGKCGRKFDDFGIMTVDEYGFETSEKTQKKTVRIDVELPSGRICKAECSCFNRKL